MSITNDHPVNVRQRMSQPPGGWRNEVRGRAGPGRIARGVRVISLSLSLVYIEGRRVYQEGEATDLSTTTEKRPYQY